MYSYRLVLSSRGRLVGTMVHSGWPLINTCLAWVRPTKVGLWLDYLPKEVPSGWCASALTAVRAGCFLRRQGTVLVGTYMYSSTWYSQGKTRCLLVRVELYIQLWNTVYSRILYITVT